MQVTLSPTHSRDFITWIWDVSWWQRAWIACTRSWVPPLAPLSKQTQSLSKKESSLEILSFPPFLCSPLGASSWISLKTVVCAKSQGSRSSGNYSSRGQGEIKACEHSLAHCLWPFTSLWYLLTKIRAFNFFPASLSPKPRSPRFPTRAAYLLKKCTQIRMVYESVLFWL